MLIAPVARERVAAAWIERAQIVTVRRLSDEGEWTNRLSLCAWHHLRGIHAGIVRAWGRAPDDGHWQLGVRSSGPPFLELLGDRYVTRTGGSDPCQQEP